MSKPSLRVFIAELEDSPGVLHRVTCLLRRRGYNIVSLNVGRTNRPAVSRMTLVVEADETVSFLLRANLAKLPCVFSVDDLTDEAKILTDLALLKIRADRASRLEILKVCEIFGARVVDVGTESLIVEWSGAPEVVSRLTNALYPFEILEMVQCGAVGMTRSSTAQRNYAA